MTTRDEEFVRRLVGRNSQARAAYRPIREEGLLEGAGGARQEANPYKDLLPETIVSIERPVLFVQKDRVTKPDKVSGFEGPALVDRLLSRSETVEPLFPLVGRIEVTNSSSSSPYVGTGWFVAADVVVTNRHVADLIARHDGRKWALRLGIDGEIGCSMNTLREYRDVNRSDPARDFKVLEVLFIEKDGNPDIAFLRVARTPDGAKPVAISIAETDVAPDRFVGVIGYPARAGTYAIPDQQQMTDLFYGEYDVKRIAPGYSLSGSAKAGTHDCTTLNGNSGSVLVDLETGLAVGLHYAGDYKRANYSVPASVLRQYVSRKRWNEAPELTSKLEPPATAPAVTASVAVPAGSNAVSVTIPITITITIGTPVSTSPAPTARSRVFDVARVEAAAAEFHASRPSDVLATRVGFFDEDDAIGDVPFIAASVSPDRLAQVVHQGPDEVHGIPIHYIPADPSEQIAARPQVESATSILYDDDARTSGDFSFDPIEEDMSVIMHVGPEYSWAVLNKFLQEAQGRLVSAMYEFHATHIKDEIERRLNEGLAYTLVLDDKTFHGEREGDFDRLAVFADWATKYPAFQRIVAPEGNAGLISDAYHIKVSIRDDDTFWLSSGNWKAGSSQPLVTKADLQGATASDLPGNREWHVVVRNATLARHYRAHVLQDFERSRALGAREVPSKKRREHVLVPLQDESVVLERRPPDEILAPVRIERPVKVRSLLTPDRKGAVFCDAVLDLITSAKHSLLFQIPYITLPPNPRANRGFIDQLIAALTTALKNLDDARVLLSGGSKFSDPRHVAWYLKSKKVDIGSRLHAIERHHTKGMIVDDRYVLLGSQNWSAPGVTLNRDASLLFDDRDVAAYYRRAFEVDWRRSNPVTSKRYKVPVREAIGAPSLVPVFVAMDLADVMADD